MTSMHMGSAAVQIDDSPSSRADSLTRALDESRLSHEHLLITGPGTHDIFVTADDHSRRLTALMHGYCQACELGFVRYSLAAGVSTWGTLPGGEAIRVRPSSQETHPSQAVEQAISDLRTAGREAMLVIDWADAIVPTGRDLGLDLLGLCERIQALASDHEWHQAGLRLVIIDRTNSVTPRLLQQPGIRVHRIGAPGESERAQFSSLASRASAQPMILDMGLTPDKLGRFAGGLFNLDLQRCRRTSSPDHPVTARTITYAKSEAIRQTSGNTLELMPTELTFANDVAGMPAVQLAVQAALRAGRRGIRMLLAGPPGTGKSLSASAIAAALDLPCVRYGQILNEYVGVAERNIAAANDLLLSMAPLVLFRDELDQSGFGKRAHNRGDNQVHQNIRAAMLEFLGEGPEKTGISVIAATNVPRQLDDAALSRFPVIPVLFASGPELAQIMAIQARIERIPLADDFTRIFTQYVENGGVLSGRSVPGVLTKAWDLALELGHSELRREHVDEALRGWIASDWTPEAEYSTLTSLLTARHIDAWPWVAAQKLGIPYTIPNYLRGYVSTDGHVDPNAMEERVRELEMGGVYGL